MSSQSSPEKISLVGVKNTINVFSPTNTTVLIPNKRDRV